MIISTAAVLGAVGVGFVVGYIVGIMQKVYIHSKRECRACMRRMVEYGFQVDGKNYKPVKSAV